MNRIKELRKASGLTLDELSEKIEINRATLNRYENEKSEPKLKTWQVMASFFNVSIPYLQGVSSIKEPLEIDNNTSDVAIGDWMSITGKFAFLAEALDRTEYTDRFGALFEILQKIYFVLSTESADRNLLFSKLSEEMASAINKLSEIPAIDIPNTFSFPAAGELSDEDYKEIFENQLPEHFENYKKSVDDYTATSDNTLDATDNKDN